MKKNVSTVFSILALSCGLMTHAALADAILKQSIQAIGINASTDLKHLGVISVTKPFAAKGGQLNPATLQSQETPKNPDGSASASITGSSKVGGQDIDANTTGGSIVVKVTTQASATFNGTSHWGAAGDVNKWSKDGTAAGTIEFETDGASTINFQAGLSASKSGNASASGTVYFLTCSLSGCTVTQWWSLTSSKQSVSLDVKWGGVYRLMIFVQATSYASASPFQTSSSASGSASGYLTFQAKTP